MGNPKRSDPLDSVCAASLRGENEGDLRGPLSLPGRLVASWRPGGFFLWDISLSKVAVCLSNVGRDAFPISRRYGTTSTEPENEHTCCPPPPPQEKIRSQILASPEFSSAMQILVFLAAC